MKVLYIASRGVESGSLQLEQEITAVQAKLASASGEPVKFRFLPDLKLERFPLELDTFKPDVLHISAHGTEDGLHFSDEKGDAVQVTAERLIAILKLAPPKLLLLSACESERVADRVSELVPAVIGTSAPITNEAARACAVILYHCLLTGRDLKTAFDASNAVVESLNEGVRTVLRCRQDIEPKNEILHQVPQLVAKFSGDKMEPHSDNNFTFDLGLVGCPNDTWHVVYFTDDEEFAEIDEDTLESDMCTVSRASAAQALERTQVWEDRAWRALGDHRIYACGVTTAGESLVVSSSLCRAIELYYMIENRITSPDKLPSAVRRALSILRANDGTKFSEKPKAKIPVTGLAKKKKARIKV